MWNFFKKRVGLQDWEKEMLLVVVEALPAKYDYLKEQINKNFIIRVNNNITDIKNYRKFSYNTALLNKFYSEKQPSEALKNIIITDLNGRKYQLSLYLTSGFVNGYSLTPKSNGMKIKSVNLELIIYEELGDKKLVKMLETIIGSIANYKWLKKEYLFEVQFEKEIYIAIKQLEDANVLAIKVSTGEVYCIFHDKPNTIKIADNLEVYKNSPPNLDEDR